MRNYSNHSIEALNSLLEDCIIDTCEGVLKAAHILQALALKGESHPLAKEGTLKFFREIAAGKLHPRAALVFSDASPVLPKIVGLPFDVQEEICRTRELPVVEIDPKTDKAMTIKKSVYTFDSKGEKTTLDRVFGQGRLRSETEQEKLLRREAAHKAAQVAPERGGIRVDVTNNKLLIGNSRIDPKDLKAPLAKLGYNLVWVGKK